jgi:hypothetical protein
MNLIKLDMTDQSIPDLIADQQKIVAKMTANATFTSIATDVTALGTAVAALVTSNTNYNAAVADGTTKKQLRDNARIAVENASRTLANKAEGVTTDAAALESGGYVLRAGATPVGPMPKPQGAAATLGDLPGTVDFHWDSIKRGVQTYIAQSATSSGGPWTQFYVGKASKCEAGGLVSGTQYWFQVCAVGAAGPGPFSDPATSRAA